MSISLVIHKLIPVESIQELVSAFYPWLRGTIYFFWCPHIWIFILWTVMWIKVVFIFQGIFKFGGLVWMENEYRRTWTYSLPLLQSSCQIPILTRTQLSRESLKIFAAKGNRLLPRKMSYKNKTGNVNLWHLDSIYRALGLQTRLPRQRDKPRNLRSFIQQPLIDFLRESSFNLLPPAKAETFTSNPCWNPAVEAVGRVGVKSMLPLGGRRLHSEPTFWPSLSLSPAPCPVEGKSCPL